MIQEESTQIKPEPAIPPRNPNDLRQTAGKLELTFIFWRHYGAPVVVGSVGVKDFRVTAISAGALQNFKKFQLELFQCSGLWANHPGEQPGVAGKVAWQKAVAAAIEAGGLLR